MLILLPIAIYAKGESDIIPLIKTGTYKDLQSAVSLNKNLIYTKTGDTEDNLLMSAIKADREYKVLDMLMQAGIDPLSKNKKKQTALMFACQYSSHEDVIRFFITTETLFDFQKKSRILQKDDDGKDSFDYAQASNNTKALAILQEYVNDSTNTKKNTPAIKKNKDTEKDTDLKQIDSTDTTQISSVPTKSDITKEKVNTKSSTTSKNEEKVNTLSKNKNIGHTIIPPYKPTYMFDFDTQLNSDEKENINTTKTETTEIPSFSEINKKDKNGRTLLMNACLKNNETTVINLLQNNADVTIKDNDGWTALMYAVRYNNTVSIIKHLLDAGADKNVKNNFGITPLDAAAGFCNNPEIFNLLLQKYAPSSREFRQMFINSIESQRSVDVIKVFIDRGAELNSIYGKFTPLMYAAKYNSSTNIISLLLNEGAIKSFRTQKGETAFDLAEKNENLPHNNVYWKLNSQADN